MRLDPKKITKLDRTQAELEWFLLFCISTAGKDAMVQAKKINEMIDLSHKIKHYQSIGIYSIGCSDTMPINYEYCSEWMVEFAKLFKLGKYDLIRKSSENIFKNGIHKRLDTVTLDELLQIPGVGNKTARFFLMHSRPGFEGAVIDTHVHTWLEKVCQSDLPKPTTTAKYISLERLWLSMVKIFFPGEPLHVVDLATWDLIRTWPDYDPFDSRWDICLETAIAKANSF